MLTNKKNSTLRLVQLSILVAIVIVLQLAGTAVKLNILGTSVSLVLIPIVLGAMLLGPKAGAVLGFIFGIITYLMGVFGLDAFTFILFQDHPVLTALICIVKGTAAGLVARYVYEACQKAWNGKKNLLATFLASAAAPIVNTGLFILGSFTVADTLQSNFVGEGETLLYFLIIGCAGINFLLELALNLIAAPALFRLFQFFGKKRPVA